MIENKQITLSRWIISDGKQINIMNKKDFKFKLTWETIFHGGAKSEASVGLTCTAETITEAREMAENYAKSFITNEKQEREFGYKVYLKKLEYIKD